ncbi:MAG: hypothetical protein SGJ19_13195 [Planctomycetia bacterium]|nr:hypothetical protein [Planctomycetia bacterium]
MSSAPDHPNESPWLWLVVFSLVALVAVLMIGPKFMLRQARLEQKLEGRVRAQQPLETRPDEPLVGERGGGENNLITVAPLAGFLCVLAAVGYFQWTRERARWLQYQRTHAAAPAAAEKVEHAP